MAYQVVNPQDVEWEVVHSADVLLVLAKTRSVVDWFVRLVVVGKIDVADVASMNVADVVLMNAVDAALEVAVSEIA